MAKNTTKKINDINTKLVNELIAIRTARKEAHKQFKLDIQKVWDAYRAEKTGLRERKAAAWKAYAEAKAAAKAERKAKVTAKRTKTVKCAKKVATKKVAVKKAAKKAATKKSAK